MEKEKIKDLMLNAAKYPIEEFTTEEAEKLDFEIRGK